MVVTLEHAMVEETKSISNQRKNRLDFDEIKNFSTSRDTIQKVKRQPREWEKILANHLSGKEFASRKKNT